MKRYICLLILFSFNVLASAQNQQGYVKTKGRLGSNGKVISGIRIPGATIQIKDANAVLSNGDGAFSLSVSGIFYLQDVQKHGYVMTDPDILLRQYTYSNTPLVLVLETLEEQVDDKITTERRIRRTLQRQLQDKEDEIESLKKQNKLSEEAYRRQLQDLYARQESNEQLISEMTERYSRIDFDCVDEFNRRISSLILEGNLTEADSLLNTKGDINSRAALLKKQQEANALAEKELKRKQRKLEKSKELAQKELENLAQDCYSKFEIFKMRHLNDSAAFYIKLRAGLDSSNVGFLLETGDFLKEYFADYSSSIDYYLQALKYACFTDSTSRDIVNVYNCLGNAYLNMGDFDKALQYHKTALDFSILHFGERDYLTALTYNDLGHVYYFLSNYDLAKEYFTKDLEITLAAIDNTHKDIATSYSNLAQVSYRMGDYDMAIKYGQLAIDFDYKEFGENNPKIATLYNNQGLAYKRMADFSGIESYYDKALDLYNNALRIRKEFYGEEHPEVAALYSNIGGVYEAQEDYDKALDYSLKDLKISQKTLGLSHPSVATSYNNVGLVYKRMGIFNKALEYYNQALTIRLKVFPERSTDVAGSYNNMGMLYYNVKDYNKAIEYLEKSYSIFNECLGPEHNITQIVKNHLQNAHEAFGANDVH